MVNTFLTVTAKHSSDLEAFFKTATDLDRPRLQKQRVEAQQILDILHKLRILASLFGHPGFPSNQPSSLEERKSWIRSTLDLLKRNFYKAIVILSNQTTFPIYKNQNLSTDQLKTLYPGATIITDGFAYHTATAAWLGYENALSFYTNIMIEEFIRRGYQNNMPFNRVSFPVTLPPWCSSIPVVSAMRVNLLCKEIDRNEPLHYSYKTEFVHDFTQSSDLWFQHLSDTRGRVNTQYLLSLGSRREYIWP